jgi:hypothetical protein
MQTEEPHWLAESYASAFNEIDIGPVNRAISRTGVMREALSCDPVSRAPSDIRV